MGMDFLSLSSERAPNYCPDCMEEGEEVEMEPDTVHDPTMHEATEANVCPQCGRTEYAGLS